MALVNTLISNERQVVGHYSWTHEVEGSILCGALKHMIIYSIVSRESQNMENMKTNKLLEYYL